MPEIIDVSPILRISDRTDPQLDFHTRSGGVALNGAEQIVSPLSSVWRFRAVFPIVTKPQARAIRVLKSKLQGRFNFVRLRICDRYGISRRDVGAWYPESDVSHSDGAYFSDGSGYSLAPPTSPVTSAGAAGDLTLTVRASDFNDAMSSGVFFSVNDWLYQVDNWELVGTDYVMEISPPLREAVAIDDIADFDPKCLWRLDTDLEGSLDLQIGKFGAVTLSLVEPITR